MPAVVLLKYTTVYAQEMDLLQLRNWHHCLQWQDLNLFEIFNVNLNFIFETILLFFFSLLFLVEFHQGSSHTFVNDKSRGTGNQFDEQDTLTTEFMSYIEVSLSQC